MKSSQPESKPIWETTSVPKLVRYVSSGIFFARLHVKGKLIRKSLRTKSLSVAKLRLTDLEKAERQQAEHSSSFAEGKMTFADALAIFRQRLHEDLVALFKSDSRQLAFIRG